MEKLELERMEVLFLPCQYFISSHATRVDDGSISLFLSFFLSFFFFLLFGTGWDGIRLLFVVGSELSAVSGSQLQLLLSSAQVGGTEERAGGIPDLAAISSVVSSCSIYSHS